MGLFGDVAGAVGGIVGGVLGNQSAANTAQKNYEAQKEFAQNGIRWKVADAKAAGIHPLAALGANNASFSPSFTAGDYSWLGDAGQHVGRAIESKATRAERELGQAMQAETHAEQIRGLRLENDIRAQTLLQMKLDSLSAVKKTGRPPAMPGVDNIVLTGQGDSKYMDKPVPKFGWAYDDKGRLTLVPGADYAQRYEDKLFLEWAPFIEAGMRALDSRVTGNPVAGRVYNPDTGTWDKVSSDWYRRNKAKAGRNFPRGDLFDSYRNVWR